MSQTDYYKRKSFRHTDGTFVFENETDRERKDETARIIESKWGPYLQIKCYGQLNEIDYYATKHGRLALYIEIKCRNHKSDTYDTVYLNLRKWLALTVTGLCTGKPSIFVVRFLDKILWIPLVEVDAAQVSIAGTNRIVKSKTDIEPIIEIPIKSMRQISSSNLQNEQKQFAEK